MITIDTLITAKKQYIIDHVLPSDLDSDIKEGLRKKEEMIERIDGDYIRSIYTNLDQLLEDLNSSGISEENYIKFINGESSAIVVNETPDPPSDTIQYCIDDSDLLTYVKNTIIPIDGITRVDIKVDNQEPLSLPFKQVIEKENDSVDNVIVQGDADHYTITFDANGGVIDLTKLPTRSTEIEKDSNNYGQLPVAVHDNATFSKWVVIDSKGNKITVHSNDSLKIKGDHRVIAIWKATITYNAMGGKFSDGTNIKTQSVDDVDEARYVIPTNKIDKTDALFGSWRVSVGDDNVTIEDGDSLVIKGNHSVDAKWREKCPICGCYEPCACDPIVVNNECPQCERKLEKCICHSDNDRMVYVLITLNGIAPDTYWSRNVYWSILPKGINSYATYNEVKVDTENHTTTYTFIDDPATQHYISTTDIKNGTGCYATHGIDQKYPEAVHSAEFYEDGLLKSIVIQKEISTSQIGDMYFTAISVVKPIVPKFYKLHYMGEVSAASNLLYKKDIDLVNYINFHVTYSSLNDLYLQLMDLDYDVTPERLSILESLGYIKMYQDTVSKDDKTKFKSGYFMRVLDEAVTYVFCKDKWIRLPRAFNNLSIADNGKFLSLHYIHFGNDQVPVVKDDDGNELTGGGTYCLTSMLASEKYPENLVNSFIYFNINSEEGTGCKQSPKKKNCDKPPSCTKDKDDEDAEDAELCADNGKHNCSIDGQPACNAQSLEEMLTDAFDKNLQPIMKAIGQLKLAVGGTLQALFNLNIGLDIVGFMQVLADIAAIIAIIGEIFAALAAKLTASVAIKIKVDIGFSLLAKITGRIKASLELLRDQIKCFMDSLLPDLHIEFETEINLSLDNIINQGDIVQSKLNAELDTGILGKKFSYSAAASLGANGEISADHVARLANNGSFAHAVLGKLVDSGILSPSGMIATAIDNVTGSDIASKMNFMPDAVANKMMSKGLAAIDRATFTKSGGFSTTVSLANGGLLPLGTPEALVADHILEKTGTYKAIDNTVNRISELAKDGIYNATNVKNLVAAGIITGGLDPVTGITAIGIAEAANNGRYSGEILGTLTGAGILTKSGDVFAGVDLSLDFAVSKANKGLLSKASMTALTNNKAFGAIDPVYSVIDKTVDQISGDAKSGKYSKSTIDNLITAGILTGAMDPVTGVTAKTITEAANSGKYSASILSDFDSNNIIKGNATSGYNCIDKTASYLSNKINTDSEYSVLKNSFVTNDIIQLDGQSYVAGPGMKSDAQIMSEAKDAAKKILPVATYKKDLQSLNIKPRLLKAEASSSGEDGASAGLSMAAKAQAVSYVKIDQANIKALNKSAKILKEFSLSINAADFVKTNDADSLIKYKEQADAALQLSAEAAAAAGLEVGGDLSINFSMSYQASMTEMIGAMAQGGIGAIQSVAKNVTTSMSVYATGRVNAGMLDADTAANAIVSADLSIGASIEAAASACCGGGASIAASVSADLFGSIVPQSEQEEFATRCGSCLSKAFDDAQQMTETQRVNIQNETRKQLFTLSDMFVSSGIYYEINQAAKAVTKRFEDLCFEINRLVDEGSIDIEVAKSAISEAETNLIHIRSVAQKSLETTCESIQNTVRSRLSIEIYEDSDVYAYKNLIDNVMSDADLVVQKASATSVNSYNNNADDILEKLSKIIP